MLPEKVEDKMKKFAIVTEYGEIDDRRAVKDVRAGKVSIYQAFDIENGTRNGRYEEKLLDTLEEAQDNSYRPQKRYLFSRLRGQLH